MAIDDRISFTPIPCWCAGVKVSGLTASTIKGLKMKELINASFKAEDADSVLCATVNIEEEKVIAWLEENKWIPGPWLKNHNHGGRKTAMYFKQVTKARYERG